MKPLAALLATLVLVAAPAAATPSTPLIKGADLNLLEAVRAIGGEVEKLRGERFDRPPLAVRVTDDMRNVAAEIRAFSVIDRDRLAARGRAWADVGLPARARAAGLDPQASLARNDSNPLLAATGDLFVTGPTQTNVNDLALLRVHGG